MGRRPSPWFRTETGWWMVMLGGKRHKLAEGKKNKKLAYEKFHELCSKSLRPADASDVRVADIAEAFLTWSIRHQAASTYEGYRFYVQSFCEACGQDLVQTLKPYRVTRWIDSKEWNETTQYNAVRTAIRVMNWAKGQGLIKDNPLHGMERPRPNNRERCLTDAEYRKVLQGSHGQFRIFVYVMRQTGARPSEVRRLTWDMVHDDRCQPNRYRHEHLV